MRVSDGLKMGLQRASQPRAARSSAAKPAIPDKEQARLRDACQQFEAIFLAQLLQKMRETVPKDPLLGDSRAKDIYNSMLDWELAQQIARSQSVGIAETLYRQLSRVAAAESGGANKGGASAAERAVAPAADGPNEPALGAK